MITEEEVKSTFFGFLESSGAMPSIVDWPGADVDTANATEWARPDVIGVTPIPGRVGSEVAETELQVSIFVRDLDGNAYRPDELADSVREALHRTNIDDGAGLFLRCREAQVEMIDEFEEQARIVRVPCQIER